MRKQKVGSAVSSTRLLLSFSVVGCLAIWLLAIRVDHAMRNDLLVQTRLAARTVNLDRIKALSGTERDLGTPTYLRVKEQLAGIRAVNPKCSFVYLMARRADDKVFFYADSEPVGSDNESPAGQPY